MMIPYRTKAVMKILMELTREEAYQLFDVAKEVQKKFYIGDRIFPLNELKIEDAVDNMKKILTDSGLDIPAHLRGHLERFLELMINERAPMDMLESELNSAFEPVSRYDLFRPDTQEEPAGEPIPEASAKGPDISFSGTVVDGDTIGTDKEDTGGLEHIRDEMIDLLVERGLSLSKMASVFEMTLDTLISIKDTCKKAIDETPLKELRKIWKEKEERDGQKEG